MLCITKLSSRYVRHIVQVSCMSCHLSDYIRLTIQVVMHDIDIPYKLSCMTLTYHTSGHSYHTSGHTWYTIQVVMHDIPYKWSYMTYPTSRHVQHILQVSCMSCHVWHNLGMSLIGIKTNVRWDKQWIG